MASAETTNAMDNAAPVADTAPDDDSTPRPEGRGGRSIVQTSPLGETATRILMPLASLKLTVALFALAIFIVLVGTLAQVRMDIWEVIDEYFRVKFSSSGSLWDWFNATFVRIDFNVFFPPAFFPDGPRDVPGGFYFPKGWVIGALMALNLLAAHLVRFKIQARGPRLYSGLATIAVGCIVTWMVIASGSNKEGFQAVPWFDWSRLWLLLKLGLAGVWLASGYALVTLPAERKVERYGLTGVIVALGCLIAWLFFRGSDAQMSDPSMRILWQLIKGTAAGLVLLAGCWLVFKKRAGIVLLHGGIGLMMFSELLVGMTHVETLMSIVEGETADYTQDTREVELAIIDASEKNENHETIVPGWMLAELETIDDERLPFQIDVIEYLRNAGIRGSSRGDRQNPATHGYGVNRRLVEQRAGVGTDTGGSVDMPGAYLRLKTKDGEKLGTRMVSAAMEMADYQPETVKVGDKEYAIELRFRRYYKPYRLKLLDVRKDDYIGTDTPRNYSSDVRLVDESRNVDREVHIWMNNPLRYAGETFYQSGYHFLPREQKEATTLQVVANNGWMIPYISCMIVAVGLLAQFGLTLGRFLDRRKRQNRPHAEVAAVEETAVPTSTKSRKKRKGKTAKPVFDPTPPAEPSGPAWHETLGRYFPAIVVGVMALWVLSKLAPPRAKPTEMLIHEFGKLPVVYQGRAKPYDTLARNTLRIVSDRQTFVDDEGQTQPAIRWFLDVITQPTAAADHKVFRIENHEVQRLLELEPRKGFRYSVAEMQPRFQEFLKQVQLIREETRKDPSHKERLSVFQRKILELETRLGAMELLYLAFREIDLAEEMTAAEEDIINDAIRLARTANGLTESLKSRNPPFALPPLTEEDAWQPYAIGYMSDSLAPQDAEEERSVLVLRKVFELINADFQPSEEPRPTVEMLSNAFEAYRRNDAKAFNAQVEKLQEHLDDEVPAEVSPARIRYEAYFNHVEPFYLCTALYVIAFILAASAWLGWSGPLNRAAFWLIVFTLVVHSYALISRIYISGRPPVTNLYGSAVFIGWGCVVLGLVLEAIYRIGIGNVIASVTGYATLLIAHLLTTMVSDHKGDTMAVLQAVLDTQFWLATHVVCITMGYATTFLAGALGLAYIVRGHRYGFLLSGLGLLPASYYLMFKSIWDPAFITGVLVALFAVGCLARAVLMRTGERRFVFDAETSKTLARMTYGMLCFALFFSFVGTVLGGLWADDSWGRFWGWDPKENGALIIVLWNALVLHARWGGMVRDRGLAVLAVGGNIATAWSWFGVNELGVGLHSYGFTDGVLMVLGIFVASQLAYIAIGATPKSLWWSEREQGVV